VWNEDLKALKIGSFTRDKLADEMAKTLQKRRTLLRIQSTNLYEIEDHSRIECLTHFKVVMEETMSTVSALLEKHLHASAEEIDHFIYIFFPFLYGAFPYSEPTKKQCLAMDAAGIPHPQTSIYDLVDNCLLKILP
jgi:hypothetical protein